MHLSIKLFKRTLYRLLESLCGDIGARVFWCIYWYLEERKEKANLGFSSNIPIRGSERATLIEALCSTPFESVLEIGFGYGQNLIVLEELYPSDEIFALELNLDRLLATREILPGLHFANGDIRSLPFLDKSVDVVFVSAVLLYINSEDLLLALRELCRVARKRIVMLEQQTLGREQELEGGVSGGKYWIRNYREVMERVGAKQIEEIKIKNPRWPVESWEACGVVFSIVP